jgi:hypothetical protein
MFFCDLMITIQNGNMLEIQGVLIGSFFRAQIYF